MLLLHRGFENNSFDEISGIGIQEGSLNILSCNSFIQEKNSTLILTCRSKLVSYYLSKGFVTIEFFSKASKNVPQTVQNSINAINMYESDSIMSYSTQMNLIKNTLNNIYLGGPI